ncbi:DUF2637 domain-containing protein, partial [Streptomyces megasporus]|uniref:DUF2637 domain-containing protein n=1 Tax=Streptomyces megasporus TaxID=44060 RepID=UPI0004E1E62F
VAVEAARHAVGRIADITADKHMEGVRLSRWLLAPWPTFRLFRMMKLWELRSYDQVIRMEQDRLIYEARLRARYGRGWKRRAPVEALMPLRLARYGVPLAETAPAGLAAAGIQLAATPAAQSPAKATGILAPADRRTPMPPPEREAAPERPDPESSASPPATPGTGHEDAPGRHEHLEGIPEPPAPQPALSSKPLRSDRADPALPNEMPPRSADSRSAPNLQTGQAPEVDGPDSWTSRTPEPNQKTEQTRKAPLPRRRGGITKQVRQERLRQVLDLVRADPEISGTEVERRTGIPERTARRLVKEAKAQVAAEGKPVLHAG